jgi:hypothetical protein
MAIENGSELVLLRIIKKESLKMKPDYLERAEPR